MIYNALSRTSILTIQRSVVYVIIYKALCIIHMCNIHQQYTALGQYLADKKNS